MIESVRLVGTVRRINAPPALTINRTGGATMATEDSTVVPPVTVYTDKHRTPFLIDPDDYEAVSRYLWHQDGRGYVTTHVGKGPDSKNMRLHAFLLGRAPAGFEWDHHDRDKLNNRRHNLRLVTHAVNNRNRNLLRNNTSGATGVCWDARKKRWRVTICNGQKVMGIGRYRTFDAAVAARKAAENMVWGDAR